MTFTKWEVVHRYDRLVRRGIAGAISCSTCEAPFIKKIGPNEDPVYYCLTCRETHTIGLALLDRMREAIEPYFSEEE